MNSMFFLTWFRLDLSWNISWMKVCERHVSIFYLSSILIFFLILEKLYKKYKSGFKKVFKTICGHKNRKATPKFWTLTLEGPGQKVLLLWVSDGDSSSVQRHLLSRSVHHWAFK